MNRWESHFTNTHQQQGVLMEEQRFSDLNPIYATANVTERYQKHTT
jgi:hypothetical protein